jgi:hypothetical protein
MRLFLSDTGIACAEAACRDRCGAGRIGPVDRPARRVLLVARPGQQSPGEPSGAIHGSWAF